VDLSSSNSLYQPQSSQHLPCALYHAARSSERGQNASGGRAAAWYRLRCQRPSARPGYHHDLHGWHECPLWRYVCGDQHKLPPDPGSRHGQSHVHRSLPPHACGGASQCPGCGDGHLSVHCNGIRAWRLSDFCCAWACASCTSKRLPPSSLRASSAAKPRVVGEQHLPQFHWALRQSITQCHI
jgi:hypothetical protein